MSVIDLVAVRAGLRRLDALATAHPDLVGSRGPDPDNLHGWEHLLADDEERMPSTRMVGFRFSDLLKDRLERYREKLQASTPGLDVTMADTVRVLLTKALDAEGIQPAKGAPDLGE